MDDANLFKMFTCFMKSYQSHGGAEEVTQAQQHSSDEDSLPSKGICYISPLVIQGFFQDFRQGGGGANVVIVGLRGGKNHSSILS